jgi:nickel-type superoxide dismutase maturation protease
MSLHRLRGWPPVAPLRRVEVSGESMLPDLRPGDRLLVSPLGRVRTGDVVALRDPRQPGRILVKRVAAGPGGAVTVGGVVIEAKRGVVVLGDNLAASTDSRTFGPVPAGALLGRCLLRYHPEARRGPLPRRG